MKQLLKNYQWFLLLPLFWSCAAPSVGDGLSKEVRVAAIQSAVNSRQFSFKAVSASTQRGRNINLSGIYGITVKPDMVSADLPFYGTSFGGGAYGGDGGIRFDSQKFEYNEEVGKKGGWTITIMPKDRPEVQKIILMIGAEGYTNVTVMSTNRSSMNYSGNVEIKK